MKRLAKRGDLGWKLRDAECIGYCRGFADMHYEIRTFETAAEYAAWLRGWRAGQAELKQQRAVEAADQAQIERIQASNVDADASYQTIYTGAGTQQDYYADQGGFAFYRANLSAYTSGGMPTVIVQR